MCPSWMPKVMAPLSPLAEKGVVFHESIRASVRPLAPCVTANRYPTVKLRPLISRGMRCRCSWDLPGHLAQLEAYHRVVQVEGEVTEVVEALDRCHEVDTLEGLSDEEVRLLVEVCLVCNDGVSVQGCQYKIKGLTSRQELGDLSSDIDSVRLRTTLRRWALGLVGAEAIESDQNSCAPST